MRNGRWNGQASSGSLEAIATSTLASHPARGEERTLGGMGRNGLVLEDEVRRQLLDDEQTLVDGFDPCRRAGGHEGRHVGSLGCTTAGYRLGPDNDAVPVAGLRYKAPRERESGLLDRLLRSQGVHTANVRDRH